MSSSTVEVLERRVQELEKERDELERNMQRERDKS